MIKKITKILNVFLLLLLISVCSIGIIQENLSIQDDDLTNELPVPKTSGYTVTQKWKWKNTTVGSDAYVEISLDGNFIVARWYNNPNVTLFNKDSNATVWIYESSAYIQDVAISGDGKYIVVCNGTHVILLDNLKETPKTALWVFQCGSSVDCVDISLTGDFIITKNNTYIFLLNKSGQVEWFYNAGTPIYDLAISGDGSHVIASDDNADVHMFNTTDYDQGITMWTYDTVGLGKFVAISDNGNFAVAVDSSNVVDFFNTTDFDGIAMWTYNAPTIIEDLAISSDGKNILVTNRDYMDYFNNSFSAVPKMAMWSFPTTDDYCCGDINADGTYCVGGTWSGASVYLLNNSITNPKSEEWSGLSEIQDIAISGWGDHFIVSDQFETLYLFHHDRPIPDDKKLKDKGDDDDDDEFSLVIPFGNYYLVFAAIAIVELVLIKRRKTIHTKNHL